MAISLDKPGRYNAGSVFNGHAGAVLDFDFHPFKDNLIASCSEDQTIKLWDIPEGGLTENITTPVADMKGHNRRVTLLRFHPTADNVLASVSKDNEIKIWDVEASRELMSNKESQDLIQDIVWDYTGKNYATATKDKLVSFYDARSGTATQSVAAHEGSKGVKLTYLGNTGNFLSVGFTRQSGRQFRIWDPRALDKPLHSENIDTASGAIIPFYDEDTSILYLSGKGDGNVRYYEILPTTKPYQYPITSFKSNVPSKGCAWVPKRKLNVMKCETARMLKLTPSTMEPITFTVPRKSEMFQDDIFPDAVAGIAGCTASEWMAGTNCEPPRVSLDPAKGASVSAAVPVASSAAAVAPDPVRAPRHTSVPADFAKNTFSVDKSATALAAELAKANTRIRELEERLQAAGLSTD